ncbi:MAG: S41 family peptidase [Bacteroidota bacterium]
MMKSVTLLLTLLMAFTNAPTELCAQSTTLTQNQRDAIIQKTATELINRYVFPDKAKEIAKELEKQQAAGAFDELDDRDAFVDSLNAILYHVSKDKHISLSKKEMHSNAQGEQGDWTASRLQERTFYRRYNANFKSVEKLDDNIAYLDLRGFYGLDYGRNFADHAMAQLSTADAIIIDLRNNSGGRGDMVGYLLSYFFEEQIITGKSRKRSGDQFTDRTHRTPIRLTGKTIADVPVFLLTSKRTFSAAEGFSYPMQAYGRATIIGETTKGGANAGDLISIDDELQIFIPDVAALPHPKTNEIWEGRGIVPDVKAESEQAMRVALPLAKKAAHAYKTTMDKKAKELLIKLNETVANYDGSNPQLIVDAYLACRQYDIIFEEWELNALGYQFLADKQLDTALAIFQTNATLYPHSANAFDSYAEALLAKGQQQQAIKQYEKAIDLATQYQSDQLDQFINHLNKAKK